MLLSGQAKIAGVMGWPVDHSLSPRLHGYWLAKYGIDGAYVPLAVRPEALATALKALPALGIRGVNLTVPHKRAALDHLDAVDRQAERVGSVNTLVVTSDGKLSGSSTDGYGFIENIRAAVPDWTSRKGPAVLLGAGGAARAIAFALIDDGVPELILANRTRNTAAALADDLAQAAGGRTAITVVAWEQRNDALGQAALLVNATSLGMTGQAPLALDLARLPTTALVNDIVYTPLQTPLLAAAAARGCRTVDGLGMLLHQARPGFRAWFGRDPEVTPELRAHLLVEQPGSPEV